ncbi:hypothetical protein QQS21_006112 [Conoideocrella luteorostrata]|uniref:Uncharacterized protein n=1 Tax=Conoideocrella luteorostrata TaxID=1105319 RepID=A0AAJ0CN55_9HYPO|nr:hypothetical protein QQS21_006112 [Conoideocrella luteorostrata]
MFSPLLEAPPGWPLPDPSEDAQWYGEIWVKYPLKHSRTPSYFGQIFKTRSQFRVIMNEFCQAAYADVAKMSLARANTLRSRLITWFDGLPGQLQPKTTIRPAQLQLHHVRTLALHWAESRCTTTNNRRRNQKISPNPRPTLTIYATRFDAMDLFIVIPLVLAGSQCIEAINEQTPASQLETLRSTLILVTKGLSSQRRNHYLRKALFRVIRGRMRQQEAALLRETGSGRG